VGGRGTLYGARGRVLVNYAKTFFTGALPECGLYALGALFVLAPSFCARPDGLMSWSKRSRTLRLAQKPPPPPASRHPEKILDVSEAGARRRHTICRARFSTSRKLTVSFDGSRRLNALPSRTFGELPLHHRAERAGKTTMMDVIPQNKPTRHHRVSGARRYPPEAHEPANREVGIGEIQKPAV